MPRNGPQHDPTRAVHPAGDCSGRRARGHLATVRTKIGAALRSAKSFVVTTTAATGFSVTMTFVTPDRYHSSLAYNRSNRDVVLVDRVAYVSSDGQAYHKTDAPPEVIAAQEQLREVPPTSAVTLKRSSWITRYLSCQGVIDGIASSRRRVRAWG